MMSRRLLIGTVGVLLAGAGIGLLIVGPRGWGAIAGGLGVLFALLAWRTEDGDEGPVRGETDQIEQLDEARRNELVRGTSMHLRDMKYRYSLRYDRSDRTPFTAEVNAVLLGFIPVIILDNFTDKQGYGYVAFPYDGKRWRGPGLPCGGNRDEAMAHAARCVAPLEDEDEDGDDFDDVVNR